MVKIIANWKMYLTIAESRDLAAKLALLWQEQDCKTAELIICPSNLALHDVASQLSGTPIKLGVQDISLSNDLGAFTGQTAVQQIKEINVDYAIIGHSERRKFFGVTDKMVSQQLEVLINHKVIPIICIGETQEERDQGRTDQVIVSQLQTIFNGIELPDYNFYIAYEPRWAIGSGKPVEPEEAERVHSLIRHTMLEFHSEVNDILHVIYGGSVNAENILSFVNQPTVDGALIGGASSKYEKLKNLVNVVQKNIC